MIAVSPRSIADGVRDRSSGVANPRHGFSLTDWGICNTGHISLKKFKNPVADGVSGRVAFCTQPSEGAQAFKTRFRQMPEEEAPLGALWKASIVCFEQLFFGLE